MGQKKRWIRQPIFRNVMIMLSLLQTIHALLYISPLIPYELSSGALCRPGLAKTFLQTHPLALGRIRNESHKQTSLKGLINHNNIDHSYNLNFNNDSNDGGEKSIPAHEQLYSSAKINTPKNDGVGASPLPLQTTGNVSPLKVMVFIDGTWLYYSIYGRRFKDDVISQKLGRNWKMESTPDWSSLPSISCQALLQDPKSKWSPRPIEVSRVSVYSSMHRETSKDSRRYEMFSEMIKAGFDVNMMETTGPNEKGVDIQLAVDMLYYATVPDAYDVALLLTGDKDFLPALIRCRQKGKRVGLVSMRTGSVAFEDTPNLKDYDTIWLEDYLSQWIRKMTPEELTKSTARKKAMSAEHTGQQSSQFADYGNTRQQYSKVSTPANIRKHNPKISSYTLKRVVTNFIAKSGETHVSSRDIGRHLKALVVSGQPLLDEIKAVYGGLYQFLIISEIYVVVADSRRNEKGFWVSLDGDGNKLEKNPGDDETLSGEEKTFLETYEQWTPNKMEENYFFTTANPDPMLQMMSADPNPSANKNGPEGGDSSSIDYGSLTIPELKEICREKGLKISAQKKSDLVERIEAHVKNDALRRQETKTTMSLEDYLISLTAEYLQASGGQANSRNVGRYLAANKGSSGRGTTALSELKERYGSLNTFIKGIPNFYIVHGPPESKEFDVRIGEELMMKQNLR